MNCFLHFLGKNSGYQQVILKLTDIWYGLSSFKARDTKLVRFLAKNQYSKEILLYYVNRHSAESSKIGHHFRIWSALRIEVSLLTKNTPLVFDAVGTLVSVVPDSARICRAVLWSTRLAESFRPSWPWYQGYWDNVLVISKK